MYIYLLYFFLIFAFIFLFFLIYKIIKYVYTFIFWGAIYVPTSRERVEKMTALINLQPGKKVVDLGAGDGRLVIAMAKLGIESHGYEVNPFLVARARKEITKAGLDGKAFMHCKNLWRVNVGDFDGVILYAMKHMMKKLENKLTKELKPGSVVVSNYFAFPNWKAKVAEDNIYLYIKE